MSTGKYTIRVELRNRHGRVEAVKDIESAQEELLPAADEFKAAVEEVQTLVEAGAKAKKAR